jgi:hypothetical protein
MASCEGKKSSWLSNLFEEKNQPVMWLRDNKVHLYKKYKEECCKNGRRPMSETKFRQGLEAGNFNSFSATLVDTRFRITLRVNVYNVNISANIYPPLKQNAPLKSS